MVSRQRRVIVRAGFTLMEVLVVVAIIVILAAGAGVIYTRYLDDARVDQARISVLALSQTIERYNTRYGDFPPDLSVLVTSMDGGRPYLEEKALRDPWGSPFQYDKEGPKNGGIKPDICSLGSSRGTNPNTVIGNWPVSAGVGGQ